MKVRSGSEAQHAEHEVETAPAPAKADPRRHLEKATTVAQYMEGKAARRLDAAAATNDKWSNGIKLVKHGGAAKAVHAMVLSAADCAAFKQRFAEAGEKLGVVVCGAAASPEQIAALKEKWASCGNVLGAVATAKAGKWKGLESADAGLSVATASLSQICRKVDLGVLEMKKGSVLSELKNCWVKGGPAVQLEKAERMFCEKAWEAIRPDVGNLEAALQPYAEALHEQTPPQDSHWGSLSPEGRGPG